MIKSIKFKNYKSYFDSQELELRPLTILIGKNSSGKSNITRLLTLFDDSLNTNSPEPIKLINRNIELGTEFRDLLYGRIATEALEFSFITENDNILVVKIASGLGTENSPKIIFWNYNDQIILKYDYYKNLYLNIKDNSFYDCEFNGIHLKNLISIEGGNAEIPKSDDLELKTSYVGPFRVLPSWSYTTPSKNITSIGITGENTYSILINDFLTHEKLLLKKINDWFQINFEGWKLDIVQDVLAPNFHFEFKKLEPKLSINLRNVGHGISQVLPLLVQAYLPLNEETVIILEQPELHLHPGVHGNLAQVFAESLSTKKKYVIETHSQNFVLRLRRLIAESKLKKEDLIFYYVNFDEERKSSSLERISVNDIGEVDKWPEEVFRDNLDEALAFRTAQRENVNRNR